MRKMGWLLWGLAALLLVGRGKEQASPEALRVSFNTVGEVQVRDGARLLPPLDISTPPPSEFRSALSYYRNELYPDKRLFIVRLTQHEQGTPTERFAVYEMPSQRPPHPHLRRRWLHLPTNRANPVG